MKMRQVIVPMFAGCVLAAASDASGAAGDTLPGGLREFHIAESQVVPHEQYIAHVKVIGAEITYGGRYDIPVTLRVHVGDTSFDPFGSFDAADDGNVNDQQRHHQFELPDYQQGQVPLSIEASSWLKSGSSWDRYLNVSSDEHSPNVLVLRNGDDVPNIDPFMDQNSVSYLVREYVNADTGKIQLWDDEVIFLFELGTTNLESSAADFQDLVVLVTLAKDRTRFDRPRIPLMMLYD